MLGLSLFHFEFELPSSGLTPPCRCIVTGEAERMQTSP